MKHPGRREELGRPQPAEAGPAASEVKASDEISPAAEEDSSASEVTSPA